jgi:hypothetical protein
MKIEREIPCESRSCTRLDNWKWKTRYFSLGWEPERLKDFYSPAELKFPRERNWQSETTSKIEYAYNYVRTWNQGQGKK